MLCGVGFRIYSIIPYSEQVRMEAQLLRNPEGLGGIWVYHWLTTGHDTKAIRDN